MWRISRPIKKRIMKIKRLLKIIATSSAIVTITLSLIVIALTKSQFELNRISEFAYYSKSATEDIRRHSEYMQNLCLRYVMTGDSWWLNQYRQEYAIRNGLAPSPDGHIRFWLDQYRDVGFTSSEFALLEKHNEKLKFASRIEQKVLQKAEAYYSLLPSNRSAQLQADYQDVIRTVFGDTYRAYFQIALNPLEDFIILIEKRNQELLGLFRRRTGILLYVTILLSFISIIWQFILMIQLARRVFSPLISLQQVFHGTVDTGLTVKARAPHDDEIGDLYTCYNAMIKKIKTAMDQIVLEQKNRRKAELNIMQSQINPHFLYNTLDTIVWMAEINDQKKVVQLTTSLSSFFRISLSNGMEKISLQDELVHVDNYLSIQKIRYEDTLHYNIRNKRNEYGSKIPKLIIQPFLENAIYHGIKMKRGKGNLILTIGGDENIEITVEDNGAGMDAETLNGIQALVGGHTVEDPLKSFGIRNTLERLRYHYGDRLSVMFESRMGKGTKIFLSFPAEVNYV